MTATVRIYSLSGLATLPTRHSRGQHSEDSVSALIWPYLVTETLSPDTITAASSTAAASPAKTSVLRVEVEVGKLISFEVTPQGQTLRVAGAHSPRMEGRQQFSWGEGWRFSCLEVTS